MKDLRSCFPIKDLGEAGFYLGCHITRDRDRGTLKLDQHCYMRTVALKFNVEKTSTTPAAVGAKPLSKDDASKTEAWMEDMRVTPYREAVGALMWAATMTRPDIAYAAHQPGKFNYSPVPAHGGRQKGPYNICGARRTLGSPTKERRGRAQNCRYRWTPISPLAETLGVWFQAERWCLRGARSVGSRGCRR